MSSNRFLIGSFLICVDYLWERVWQLSDNSQSPRPNSIQNYFPTFGSSNQLSSWWSRVVPIFFPSPENEPYLCKHRGLQSVNNVGFIDRITILFASRPRINFGVHNYKLSNFCTFFTLLDPTVAIWHLCRIEWKKIIKNPARSIGQQWVVLGPSTAWLAGFSQIDIIQGHSIWKSIFSTGFENFKL